MESDPLLMLIKQHFEKVNQYLQSEKNLDLLTRFSSMSSPNENTDSDEDQIDVNDSDHELELENEKNSERTCDDVEYETLSIDSWENDSEIVQKEIDFEGESLISSQNGEVIITEYEQIGSIPPFCKDTTELNNELFLERPDAPVLELTGSDEEDRSATPLLLRKIEPSPKFIVHSNRSPFRNNIEYNQFEELNKPSTSQSYGSERKVSVPQLSTSRRSSQIMIDRDKNNFELELEQYKKDIIMERVIRENSLEEITETSKSSVKSIHENCSFHGRTLSESSGKISSGSRTQFDDHAEVHSGNNSNERADIKEKFLESEEIRLSLLNDDDDIAISKICSNERTFNRKQSHHNVTPVITEMGFDLQKYVSTNHLDIHKQMLKKIEDMYKPGEGN